MEIARQLIRGVVLFFIGLFMVYLLLGAVFNALIVINAGSQDLDRAIRAGIEALIFIGAATLIAVAYNLENIGNIQKKLVTEQQEQNKLLKILIRDGRGVQPLPKNSMRDLLSQEPEF